MPRVSGNEDVGIQVFRETRIDHSGSSEYASRKQLLKEKLQHFDAEISNNEREIQRLQSLVNHQKEERNKVLRELEEIHPSNSGKTDRVNGGIDYVNEQYEWSDGLKAKMKSVFGINSFRLCQEGVCNANMDGRDIVCVMPTGGGKSLTYQLPAILQPGCTIVISPLISLITDQILHLQEAGVQAVKLTGTTSAAESSSITRQLNQLAAGKVAPEDEIKLCYVTPEKFVKSKQFKALLTTLYESSQLSRFVIDEAHCVSQLGHDFRPDYAQLYMLRKLFPHVPIMALSATCPPKVLDNLISTLGLRKVVDANDAPARGTVYFASPLYRKNLHYTIVPKPPDAAGALRTMVTYILKHHADESGIVYCLSKKDAENVAKGLQDLSENRIKTGVYHADRGDSEKEKLHVAWRRGSIQVVCATIGKSILPLLDLQLICDQAFGMGIDKGDVRFVLHHSLSKSLEGYYQESGRAGRDGKDSDCVLYYRPQDGATLSAMVAGKKDGQEKLYAMLRFAQNMEQCRKIQFANYFSHAEQVAISAWTTADSDALSRCGHCDNCQRPEGEIMRKNVTVQAWQLVKIVKALNDSGAKVTCKKVAELARGNQGGMYQVTRKKGRGKSKEEQKLDLDVVAGGAVELSKDEIEHVIVDLILLEYLGESYTPTAYTTNVYINLGPFAPNLYRLTQQAVMNSPDLKIESVLSTKVKKPVVTRTSSASKTSGKRKRVASDSEDDSEKESVSGDERDEDEPSTAARFVPRGFILDDDDTDIGDEWIISHSKKRTNLVKKSRVSEQPPPTKWIKEDDREVLEILSDGSA